ncbi:hypothetical protein TanjilG_13704 [Lupinus angustifolius]|uniref:FAD-binding FR-type domain-containing protein n=1 Tax=Lupinus angustifolius TaxID=3871 RepID=A0A1J7GWC3_LUPAN|nr:hypothetical protein TanjilG_13704 [Lupinus angustifolius]
MADQETLKKSPSQEKYGKVQSAIKILFLVLFVGWIFIWIMVPTNIERNKWLPQIRRETNSTYYGIEGASFLIYTSPFLLMAVLGCVYLHIAKKSNDSNMESCNVSKLDVAICKRPVLVKGPLGIVSGTELAFLLMFIALLIWSFAKLLHNGFVKITPQLAAKDGQTIFYLFLVDRYIRFLQSRHQVRLVSARVLPCEAIELNFSKDHGLTYNPTSVMFINIPSISKLQWHPFTVTSNSNLEPEKLSVVIKSGGTWTQNLYKILSNDSAIDRLSVSVEGPYGPASTDFLRYSS